MSRTDLLAISAVTIAFLAAGCAGASGPNPDKGRALASQLQCIVCHDVTGNNSGTAPSFKGLAGSTVKLIDGTTVLADDAYLRESIVQPNARIVEGYLPSAMLAVTKAYDADLAKPENVDDLVAYIKSLK